MILSKRLKGKAIATWLGGPGQTARAAVQTVKSKLTRSAHTLDFYFDPQDAVSYLAAQALQRLVAAYEVPFTFDVVAPPAADVNPQPIMRVAHQVRDAAELASYWDVAFPGKKTPDPNLLSRAGMVLANKRPPAEQLAAALGAGHALWSNDGKAMSEIQGKWGNNSQVSVDPAQSAGYDRLRSAGHYLGGTFHFAGSWYVGIDRISHLEQQLAKATGKSVVGVVKRRNNSEPLSLGKGELSAEFFFSFRSPYSYLAIEKLRGVVGDMPLRLRPMLPMVQRGAQLVATKRSYILLDAAREAAAANIKFGEICDPLGAGISHCLGITKWAIESNSGRAFEFVQSAMRGIWSEALDMSDYGDLKLVVERAGLDWDRAKTAAKDDVTVWATAAANDLAVFGLWGVPSLKVGELIVWGQDRLPIVAERIARHRLTQSA